jgi:hypothetical protein
MPDIDTALRQAAGLDGLVVLADTADNAGGGAPSDNTALLQALLDKDVTRAGARLHLGSRRRRGLRDAGHPQRTEGDRCPCPSVRSSDPTMSPPALSRQDLVRV